MPFGQVELSTPLAFGQEFPHSWEKLVWNFHDRMRGVKSFFILCGGVFIDLGFVVIQYALNSIFIPPGWKRCFAHDRLLILRSMWGW